MRETEPQPAAERRQKLAQGEASPDAIGMSGTLGSRFLKNLARFSGRKTFLSPAKAGPKNIRNRNPGLRCACPGLNSVAAYAGSLSASTHRHFYCTIILASIVCLCFGCNRGIDGGISSRTGGWPSATATPGEVSSSAQVVKVTTPTVQAPVGIPAEAIVRLSITPGYHVNANPATFSYLIATEVQVVPEPDGFCAKVEKPIYPSAVTRTFAFAESPLAVYEGEIEIKMPFRVPPPKEPGCYGYPQAGAKGSLPITVRVQACDTEKCFPPTTINATIPIEVK